jgi:hypothetical protein
MKAKIITLILFLSGAAGGSFAGNAFSFSDFAVNDSINVTEKELPQVKIVAFDGQLSIESSEVIAHIEVYSAIGGLLHQSEINYNELKINNLPETILVMRLKFKNGKSGVYKIKMQ